MTKGSLRLELHYLKCKWSELKELWDHVFKIVTTCCFETNFRCTYVEVNPTAISGIYNAFLLLVAVAFYRTVQIEFSPIEFSGSSSLVSGVTTTALDI